MRSWISPDLPTLPGGERTLELFNSATGHLQGLPGQRATLYVCGITPYDATHLGHAFTFVAFDTLRRTWADQGVRVMHTQCVTDIDDPLLERAEATGVDWRELASDQQDLFARDMEALNVLPPDFYVGAVESIPHLVDYLQALALRKVIYPVPVPPDENTQEDGGQDWYMDFSADKDFMSAPAIKEMEKNEDLRAIFAERGGDPERAGKRHPFDALVWRAARVGEPAWPGGRLGKGRPGWHIECAVITRETLGEKLTVQGGGADLFFPHHEMSESHLRMISENAAVNLRANAGMVAYQGEKMSKSLGNLVLVSQLREDGHDPRAIRLTLLAQHYRSDWEYRAQNLTEAENRLFIWKRAFASNNEKWDDDARAIPGQASQIIADMRAALARDLDTPAALAVVDAAAARASEMSHEERGAVVGAINALLGVDLTREIAGADLPAALLWDMDGTLVDTEPYWMRTETEVISSLGGTWSDEDGLQLVGNSLIDSARLIISQTGIEIEPEALVSRLVSGVSAKVRAEGAPWRPGALALLASARTLGIANVLVTSSYREFAYAVVEAAPEGSFQAVIAGDDVTEAKPHPEPYLAGAAAVGAAAHQCVALEDSPPGLASALASGAQTIAIENMVALPADPAYSRMGSLWEISALTLARVLSGERIDRPALADGEQGE